MDFARTAEQTAIADVARQALADLPPEAGWARAVELGWTDPDLDTVTAGVIAEECGYALHRGPWVTTATVAGLVPLTRPTTLAQTGDYSFEQIGDEWVLHGRATAPPDAILCADCVVDGLFVVDLSQTTLVPVEHAWDTTRDAYDVVFDGTPARALDGAFEMDDLALTLYACEAVGSARRAVDVAVEHAGTRVQFGRPIGVNQAVAHPLAEVYASVELAHSLAYRAAWSVGEGEPSARADALAAACATRETAVAAWETAIQTLGAVGFTWEHPAHQWYRRALWHHAHGGDPATLRAELSDLILPAGRDAS
ncbi:acyl-CoA dehydrogenase family protein [Actinokineospora enzanensis]|uniref:acyl-CoA dehydrogenase family protein n=1 Tax=Actinokineospora enzanensis TaxID=155975 RepID=UPI000382936E|nr:acyl-CoA dehydrogenase family protein [Actinokineospora enzanensis]